MVVYTVLIFTDISITLLCLLVGGGIIWGGGGDDFSQIFKRRGGMRGEGRGQNKLKLRNFGNITLKWREGVVG